MLKVLDYIIVISMFIGIAIAVDYLGWPNMQQMTPWGSSLPVTYVLCIYIILRIDKVVKSKSFSYLFYIISFILISLYRYLIGDGAGFFKVLSTIATPLFAMFWAFDMLERGNRENVRKLFLLLFAIAIVIAIYEKLFNTILFPYSHFNKYDINGTIFGEFMRSNSVWGHPLTNAFAVSVIMFFVLQSNLDNIYKYTFFVGGFVSLLCFGARGATIVSGVFGVLVFLLFGSKNANIEEKTKKLLLASVSICFLFYIVSYTNFADRVLGLNADESDYATNERIEAFQYLINIDSSALFRGIGQDDYLLEHNHIENWILLFVMQYGIIITVFIIFFFCHICFWGLKDYSLSKKICLFGVFIAVSLTNNSLAIASPAFPIFFLCCACFSPRLPLKHRTNSIIKIIKNG